MSNIIEQMYEHFVHVGHKKDLWNPRMRKNIHSTVDKRHVINLDITAKKLEQAQKFLQSVKSRGGRVLFVGTKPQAKYILQNEFEKQDKFFYIDTKWSPGLITNFKVIRQNIEHYLKLKEQFETGEIKKYTKKEVTKFKKDLDKLHSAFRGVAGMRKAPQAIVVLDAVGNQLAIAEANKKGIPVIALVDTNADPTTATFAIPANDDSTKSLRFMVQQFVSALS